MSERDLNALLTRSHRRVLIRDLSSADLLGVKQIGGANSSCQTGTVAGTHTVRGIAYQQAQAVHVALDLLELNTGEALRVEGMEDVVDIEVLATGGARRAALQVKTRSGSDWTPKPIGDVLRRWLALGTPAEFTFVTDGTLGPGAQKISDALDEARAGRFEPIAKALGISASEARLLANARITIDAASVGALLLSAERRVSALVDPLTRSREQESSQRVDALFRALTERASHATPADRVISHEELRDLVGGIAGQPPSARWPGELKEALLGQIASSPPALTKTRVRRLERDSEPLPAEALVQGGLSVLSGPTGTGKSSVAVLAQYHAAINGRIVVLGRAETYLTGRLDGFVADSLGFALGKSLPASTGRQVLADPDVVILVDGSSEIPQSSRDALGKELRALQGRPDSASIVLVGRSVADMRQMILASLPPSSFGVAPMADTEREEMALGSGVPTIDEARQVVQVADRVLGDGARNPFLLSMYIESSRNADSSLTRAAVYESFLNRMGERSGMQLGPILPILGIAFADLIQRQRRYADPYEWIALTDWAAGLDSRFTVSGAEVRRKARDSGIVVDLGFTGTVAPFHDSIADYLAGLAYSSRLAETPARLFQSDQQWLLFATELGSDFSALIARDLPFLAISASAPVVPKMGIDEMSERIQELTRLLFDQPSLEVQTTETADGRWMVRSTLSSGRQLGPVVVDCNRSPLFAAVRMWRLELKRRLSATYTPEFPRPIDVDTARDQVEKFARDRRAAVGELLSELPAKQAMLVRDAIGPTGMTGVIGEYLEDSRFGDWRLGWVNSNDVLITVGDPSDEVGRTTVRALLDSGARHAAERIVLGSIEDLVGKTGWLA